MNLKIISANIRFDNPADTAHSWANRKAILGDFLAAEHPDIICTQEGRRPQLLELSSLLPKLDLIDSHRTWIKERMYPCIFINTKKLKLIKSGDVWLSETPLEAGSKSFGSAFPRLCTWVKLTATETGQSLLIVNCHLDHCYSDTRVEQVKVLIKEIAKINSENTPLLICGDFNESPEGEVRKVLMNSSDNLYDPWTSLDLDEETTFHKFKGELKEGSRIDWVIADKSLSCQEIKINKKHRAGIYPSDHFPLVASFNI